MIKKFVIFLACAAACACASDVSTISQAPTPDSRPTGKELFYSDSLNACFLYRTYPVPQETCTPAPKGYKPVYISSYCRHGSRKLIGTGQTGRVREVLQGADRAGCLTPLGKEVYAKIVLMDEDQHVSNADLTKAGADQHRGIAERMYRNYPNVFKAKGTPVRLYSTVSQRTMMSMFAQNARLLELNPSIASTREASNSLTYLTRHPEFPEDRPMKPSAEEFINAYFDAQPLLDRLFTGKVPELKDTASFIRNIYNCAAIAGGLDLEGVGFIWDLFTYDELFILEQAMNYNWYEHNSNSPYVGDEVPASMSPLVKDFVDRADTALEQEIPGADLRFGHDSYLTAFSALIGVNGFVERVEDPLEVIDIFQDFMVAPMAGNFQMVFFRNREGDVLVKVLQNEVEAFLPVETDLYPYYHWADVRSYFLSRIEPRYMRPVIDLMER